MPTLMLSKASVANRPKTNQRRKLELELELGLGLALGLELERLLRYCCVYFVSDASNKL